MLMVVTDVRLGMQEARRAAPCKRVSGTKAVGEKAPWTSAVARQVQAAPFCPGVGGIPSTRKRESKCERAEADPTTAALEAVAERA